ncbi:MAG TPA: signal peptidase II [Firmicutes bacterium]|nr:signal peptidase II [Bacillota bacterium]
MNFLLVVALILISDRITKLVIMARLAEGQSIPVIKGFLYFTYVRNKGAAFGLLRGRVVFLSALAAACLLLVLTQWRKIAQQSFFVRWGVAISVAGAAGNLIDRLRWGAVVDFIDIRIFPIFNLADMAIVFGVGLLFWEVLFHGRS